MISFWCLNGLNGLIDAREWADCLDPNDRGVQLNFSLQCLISCVTLEICLAPEEKYVKVFVLNKYL